MKTSMILLLSTFLFFACANPPEKSEGEKETGSESTVQKETLRLNDGEKWPVNDEMKPFILASESAFNAYRLGNEQDYKALAGVLKENNDQLISSCTMQGESHDQLHLWLLPHLQLVKELTQAASQAEAEVILGRLDASFELYHTYFQ